jgi:hypothetical protein
MMLPIASVLLLAGSVLLVLVPLTFSWPGRIRWITAVTAMDVFGGGMTTIATREVLVVDASNEDQRLVVTLFAPDTGPGGATLTYVAPPRIADAALLARWRAAGTPLLLLADADHPASLHGPAHVVTGLVPAPHTTRPSLGPAVD